MNPFLSIALAFLGSILNRVANLVWDDIWAKLYELIAQAEQLYYSDNTLKRKDWVVSESIKWLESKMPLNAIQRFILLFALGSIVDSFVKALNDELGHDWVSKAKEIEAKLAGIIPVIK